MKLHETTKADAIQSLKDFGFYTLKENVVPSEERHKMIDLFEEIEKEENPDRGANYLKDDGKVALLNLHLSHPETFLNYVSHPLIMEIVREVLQDEVILSVFGGFRSRRDGKKMPHIDSRLPVQRFDQTMEMLIMICVTDFTPENGATAVWPLSHKSGMDPREVEDGNNLPGKIQCSAKAGDVIMFLGQTWHDIPSNFSSVNRWGLVIRYSRWWIKPFADFTKCSPEIFDQLTAEQKGLFGFTSRPPAPGQEPIYILRDVADLPDKYEDAIQI